MCLPCYNVQILTLSLSLQVYRATQKSPYRGKMVSLFTKCALFGHQNVIARTDTSLQRVTYPLWPIWCYACTCIFNAFFRWSVFCIFTWYTMPSNAPTSKSHVGWGLKTLEATLWDHGDRSNDLETVDLTDVAHRYHNPCVWRPLNHPL